jgi:hypothetical protein
MFRAVFLPIPATINSQRSTFFSGHPVLQDELSGTEKGTNVVFLHTTVDDGDHFQPRMLLLANRFGVRGTLKSRWQQQNELLREITRTFRSEK